jgi:hypothetical protein
VAQLVRRYTFEFFVIKELEQPGAIDDRGLRSGADS